MPRTHTLSSLLSFMVVSWDRPHRSYIKIWRVLHATLSKEKVPQMSSRTGGPPSLRVLINSATPHYRQQAVVLQHAILRTLVYDTMICLFFKIILESGVGRSYLLGITMGCHVD